jgi:O-antigen/teichoic acid export membrane protein
MYAIAYILAPFCLSLFGGRYEAESLTPLHWLILAGVISCMNYVTGTILYLAKKTFILTIINSINAVIVLGLALAWATSASDVAICWLFGEIANVVLLGLFALIALQQVRGRWDALGGDDTAPRAAAGQGPRHAHLK